VTAVKLAIIQSAYIPWKGFFDLIDRCDEYVVFDSTQFVKRHWHNRNCIKSANGPLWLTIPVATKGRYHQLISEVEVSEPWAEKHWRSIELSYRRAPHFAEIAPMVRGWYEAAAQPRLLTDINQIFLGGIAKYLGLKTRIVADTHYPAQGQKTERLVGIAKAAGATSYLSGPSARDYLDEAQFAAEGITVEWMKYEGYPEYPQINGAFVHEVSVLDLLFNLGKESYRFCKPGEAGRLS
jgi:hypothetical protein